mmetsp:Transcript_9537/g.13043  ORF Transcript_9537/g.13043 Transcript_9537/m.13043 type:complete len:109 (-) Transcript_9537:110-436(-)
MQSELDPQEDPTSPEVSTTAPPPAEAVDGDFFGRQRTLDDPSTPTNPGKQSEQVLGTPEQGDRFFSTQKVLLARAQSTALMVLDTVLMLEQMELTSPVDAKLCNRSLK